MNIYKILSAIILSVLLVVPAGLIATQTVRAHQYVYPALSVFPPITKFFGPCLVSTQFTIEVQLWNNPLSGQDVYAFDFYIDWSSIPAGYISLVNATAHSPWANSFIIANTNTTMTNWHLAITAVPPSTGLFTVDQSVLTLVFHIDKDVCFPNSVIGSFIIYPWTMSGDGTKPVPITNPEIDNGVYEQISVQPDIELATTDAAYNATTNTITAKCNSHTFDIEVDLTDVANAYGFDFTLTYDSTELETDAQHITFKAAFPPPYETLVETITIQNGVGTIHINLMRPSEKPAVCGLLVPAVDIVFHTNDIQDKGAIPITDTSSITLTSALIYSKCPDPITYTSTATPVVYSSSVWTTIPAGAFNANTAIANDNCSDLLLTVGNAVLQGFPVTGGVVIIHVTGQDPQYFAYNYDAYPYLYTYWTATGGYVNATDLFTVKLIATGDGLIQFDIPFANIAGYFGQPLTIDFYYQSTGGYTTYELGDVYTQQMLVTIGDPITYKFTPSKYDINLDCSVDVQDLMKLLPYYGKTPVSVYTALWPSTTLPVDIFDFVAIAKHFGPVDP